MDFVGEWLGSLPPVLQLPVLGRLLLSLVLGAAIGLERELSGKPAGLRTFILICAGAELLTEASLQMARFTPHDLIRSDPARIAAQIVSGIGFLGAGTILVHRGSVVGLTTAATLWVSAAIGITVGAREYVVAIGATILVLVTLFFLGWLERRLLPDRETTVLHTVLRSVPDPVALVEEALERRGFSYSRLGIEHGEEVTRLDHRIMGGRRDREALIGELGRHEHVRSVRLE